MLGKVLKSIAFVGGFFVLGLLLNWMFNRIGILNKGFAPLVWVVPLFFLLGYVIRKETK